MFDSKVFYILKHKKLGYYTTPGNVESNLLYTVDRQKILKEIERYFILEINFIKTAIIISQQFHPDEGCLAESVEMGYETNSHHTRSHFRFQTDRQKDYSIIILAKFIYYCTCRYAEESRLNVTPKSTLRVFGFPNAG